MATQSHPSMGAQGSVAGRRAARVLALFVGFACLLLLDAGVASAGPARPGEFTIEQPDGTTLRIEQFGDEWGAGYQTLAGYTLVLNDTTGFWEYAEPDPSGALVPSGKVAGTDDPAGLPPHLRSERRTGADWLAAATPASEPGLASREVLPWDNGMSGAQRSVVILVSFTDQAPSTPVAHWRDSFFGGADSVSHYYREVSFGSLGIVPAFENYGSANDGIIGWINIGYDHPDLAGGCVTDPNTSCSDASHRRLAADAIRLADPHIDYGLYDANADGSLTPNELHITVIAAGSEGAIGNRCRPAVWGHRWSLTDEEAPELDGVRLAWQGVAAGYTMFGERHCSRNDAPGTPATLGIMVHEMGHDLGWPDLYDTDGTSHGVGDWSVMGTGSWLGPDRRGTVPAHPDAFSKWYQGWLTPTAVEGTETELAVPAAAFAPAAVQLLDNPGEVDWRFQGDAGNGEYFLVENRQPIGYDFHLPGCGLLVWHIDETAPSSHAANRREEGARLVALLQADGLSELERRRDRGDGGDTWPGTSDSVRFGSGTNPSNQLYPGDFSGAAMRLISSGCSTTMTADFSADGFAADAAPPENDAFDDAVSITVPPLITETTTAFATTETGEPLAPAGCELGGAELLGTVWHRIEPDENTTIGVDTVGSDFDTVVAVYRGSSLAALTEVACSNDLDAGGGDLLSRVTFTATAGETYYVQAGGWTGGADTAGTLRLTIGESAGNDDFEYAADVAFGEPVTVSTTGAGVQPGEEIRPPSCGFTISTTGRTVWYRFMPAAAGPITVDTGGSSFDTVLAAYTGDSLADLAEIGCNDDLHGDSSRSGLSIDAQSGATYYFQVGGWAGRDGAPAAGRLVFNLNPPPAGDAFADALPLDAGTQTRSSLGATVEADEPTPSCAPATAATLWFEIAAAADGEVRLSTAGSGYDTVVAVYTGTSPATLTEVGCSAGTGDPDGGFASRLTFDGVSGESYFVQVGGTDGESGDLVLTVEEAPVNDAFGRAVTFNRLPFSRSASTELASVEQGEETSPAGCLLLGNQSIGRTLWYRYRPTETRDVVITTAGSGFDTILAVWRGAKLDSLVPVGCNDDILPLGEDADRRSQVRFTAQAGKSYYVQVGGLGASAGDLVLSVDEYSITRGVSIVLPTAGATVTGATTLIAESTGDVTSVRFEIDGTVIGTDTNGNDGWRWPWSTVGYVNGLHTVTVRAGNDPGTSDSVDVIVDNPVPDVECRGLAATIVGTAGDDTLEGTPGPDVIHGLGGNDVIEGFGGDDVICGGPGDDRLSGGNGSDLLAGEAGADVLLGWNGDDTLLGGAGPDRLLGGSGNDLLRGQQGDDLSRGGLGDDRIQDGAGNDVLEGGSGKDKLWGGIGEDRLVGDDGRDQLRGGPDGDVLLGGEDTDRLWGDAGPDYLSGGANSDFLYGGIDADELWGDAGNDRLFGWSGADELYGGPGRDQLRGQAGDDYLDGGAPADPRRGDFCSVETVRINCEIDLA